jgi:hypothetical protein
MKYETIKEKCPDTENYYSVEKVSIQTLDHSPLCVAELQTDQPSLPIHIRQGPHTIKIDNCDIPQFVRAIASMCDENYF